MRLSINLPDELHKEMLIATANQQLKTLQNVTIADFVRNAIEARVQMLKSINGADTPKHTSISDASTLIAQDFKAPVKRTAKIDARVLALLADGLSHKEVVSAVGVNILTIARIVSDHKK